MTSGGASDMPNSLGPAGLTTATNTELQTQYTTALQTLYGPDINLSSDTPDGQLINIFIQSVLDLADLLTQIYNSFNPDNAVGVILDQRVAINGIQRQAGTFTVTNVTVVNTQSVNLFGLDQTVEPIYTVSDAAGNLWELQSTQTGVAPGTHVFSFQSAVEGPIVSIPNTITIQVTIVLGVASVNNPTTYTTLGIAEESDASLRVRRQRSVSLASQGYLSGLLAALLNITGVVSAFVYENTGDSPDADGVPGHSIWVIVGGSPTDQDVATAIYQKRNAGCGMFGDKNFVVTQVDGTLFTVFWDEVETQNLFIFFTATSIDGVNQPNLSAILAGLPEIFMPGVFEEVNINNLATLVQQIDPNTLVTNAGFSTGQTQTLTLSGVAASGTFIINYNGNASSSINWNDSVGTIQTKVRLIAGLGTAVVTGSIASQSLVFNLTSIDNILGLLYVTTNSLQTAGSVAITFAYNEGLTDTLTPASKKFQFTVSSDDIVITPIILSPVTVTVAPLATQTFTPLGGYAPYSFVLTVNNSGGSVDVFTGEYTAGSTGSVTDTLQVRDAFGNTATSTISVN